MKGVRHDLSTSLTYALGEIAAKGAKRRGGRGGGGLIGGGAEASRHIGGDGFPRFFEMKIKLFAIGGDRLSGRGPGAGRGRIERGGGGFLQALDISRAELDDGWIGGARGDRLGATVVVVSDERQRDREPWDRVLEDAFHGGRFLNVVSKSRAFPGSLVF